MAMWAALDALIKVVPRATARPVCPALARGFSGVAGLVAAGEEAERMQITCLGGRLFPGTSAPPSRLLGVGTRRHSSANAKRTAARHSPSPTRSTCDARANRPTCSSTTAADSGLPTRCRSRPATPSRSSATRSTPVRSRRPSGYARRMRRSPSTRSCRSSHRPSSSPACRSCDQAASTLVAGPQN